MAEMKESLFWIVFKRNDEIIMAKPFQTMEKAKSYFKKAGFDRGSVYIKETKHEAGGGKK